MVKVGCAFGTQRDELTMRFARTAEQTSSYPQERRLDPGWEPSVQISHPKKMKSLGAPMRNAPTSTEAELQRVLLKKEEPGAFAVFTLVGMILFELMRAPFRTRQAPPEPESTQR